MLRKLPKADREVIEKYMQLEANIKKLTEKAGEIAAQPKIVSGPDLPGRPARSEDEAAHQTHRALTDFANGVIPNRCANFRADTHDLATAERKISEFEAAVAKSKPYLDTNPEFGKSVLTVQMMSGPHSGFASHKTSVNEWVQYCKKMMDQHKAALGVKDEIKKLEAEKNAMERNVTAAHEKMRMLGYLSAKSYRFKDKLLSEKNFRKIFKAKGYQLLEFRVPGHGDQEWRVYRNALDVIEYRAPGKAIIAVAKHTDGECRYFTTQNGNSMAVLQDYAGGGKYLDLRLKLGDGLKIDCL